jgi:hypothetical protein
MSRFDRLRLSGSRRPLRLRAPLVAADSLAYPSDNQTPPAHDRGELMTQNHRWPEGAAGPKAPLRRPGATGSTSASCSGLTVRRPARAAAQLRKVLYATPQALQTSVYYAPSAM